MSSFLSFNKLPHKKLFFLDSFTFLFEAGTNIDTFSEVRFRF